MASLMGRADARGLIRKIHRFSHHHPPSINFVDPFHLNQSSDFLLGSNETEIDSNKTKGDAD
eukprot:scaffold1421_cov62-Cylindrotheca_fusiformis.AAC.2